MGARAARVSAGGRHPGQRVHQVGYVSQAAFPVYHPRTSIAPGCQGTLGYGFPTALGAKAAFPRRAVLSINGDGGFDWALPELATARKYDVGLVTVVFNDQAYGNVRRSQVEQFGGRLLGTDLVNPDYVQLAESFGVRGARVTTPAELAGLPSEALGTTGEPVLVEVPVGAMANPFRRMRETPPPKARKDRVGTHVAARVRAARCTPGA
jgi:acetolactate synthase I/II/III large subunit